MRLEFLGRPPIYEGSKIADHFKFAKALRWLLIATRDGRYSGSAITVLDQDTKQIKAKGSFDEAVNELTSRLTASKDFVPEDFREEYTDRFLRLMLYLTAFNRKAKDWVCQDVRVGFDKERNQFNEGFNPEWHHVFPRKIVKDSPDVDTIANIVVLNEKANRSFSAKEPLQYLQEHNVSRERLDEQAIPPDQFLELPKFDEFLKLRSTEIVARATAYLQELGK